MSYPAFDYSEDVSSPAEDVDVPADQPDRIEWATRSLSRFAGYAAMATALMGIAYLAIR